MDELLYERFHLWTNILSQSHLRFSILIFSTIFVQLRLTCLETLFDCRLQVFKNSPKFWHFFYLLATQIVNVARFARKTFYVIFKHCAL